MCFKKYGWYGQSQSQISCITFNKVHDTTTSRYYKLLFSISVSWKGHPTVGFIDNSRIDSCCVQPMMAESNGGRCSADDGRVQWGPLFSWWWPSPMGAAVTIHCRVIIRLLGASSLILPVAITGSMVAHFVFLGVINCETSLQIRQLLICECLQFVKQYFLV